MQRISGIREGLSSECKVAPPRDALTAPGEKRRFNDTNNLTLTLTTSKNFLTPIVLLHGKAYRLLDRQNFCLEAVYFAPALHTAISPLGI